MNLKINLIIGSFLFLWSCKSEQKIPNIITEDTSFDEELFNTIAKKGNELNRGEQAPTFNLPEFKKQADFKMIYNKYTLIDFWTYWCAPCLETNKELIRFSKKYPKLQIISIHSDSNSDKWKNAIEKQQLNGWTHLEDRSKKVSELFKVEAYPTHFLIDSKGTIIELQRGIGTLIQNKLHQIYTHENQK